MVFNGILGGPGCSGKGQVADCAKRLLVLVVPGAGCQTGFRRVLAGKPLRTDQNLVPHCPGLIVARSHQSCSQCRPKAGLGRPARGPEALLSNLKYFVGGLPRVPSGPQTWSAGGSGLILSLSGVLVSCPPPPLGLALKGCSKVECLRHWASSLNGRAYEVPARHGLL